MEKYIVRVNGKEYEVEVEKVGASSEPQAVEEKPVKPAPACAGSPEHCKRQGNRT